MGASLLSGGGSLSSAYLGYLFAFIAGAAACLGAAWRARSVVPDPETRQALTWLFSGSAAWALAYVGFLLVGPALWKHLFYQASLIVGFSVVFAWLWFCSAYSGRGLHRNRRVQQFAIAVYVIVTALKVTNPLHGLYYGLEPAGGGPTGGAFGLVVTHETLYWVVMAVAYALSAAGYLMIFEFLLEAEAKVLPLGVLTGLTALPAVFNVIGHVQPALLDITHEPLGVAVFAVGLLFAYETQFSVVQLTGSVGEPNLTIGRQGRIWGLGGGIKEIIPPLSEEDLGRPLREALPGLAEALQAGEAVWEAQFGERSGNRREDGCHQQIEGQRRAEGQRQAEGHPRGRTARHYRIMTSALRSGEDPKTVVLSDITDRRRRRKELERRDDLFRKAQSLADVGAWEYDIRDADTQGADAQSADLQDGCLSWSEEVYRIHGLSGGAGRFGGAGLSGGASSPEDAGSSEGGEDPEGEDPEDVEPFEDGEELSVEHALSFYHREDRQRIEGALRRAIGQGVPFDEEARIRRPDGQVRWVRIYGEPQGETLQGEEPQGENPQAEDPAWVGGGKAAARVRGAVQDITDRKRREKILRRLREKYQGLLEGAPDAIFVASAESGRIVEANQAAASLLGAPAEEIAGRHQSELHPSGEAEKYRSLFETATEEAEAEGMSFRHLEDGSQIYVETDSGERVPVEISATTVDLSGGQEGPGSGEPSGREPSGGGPNSGGQEIPKKKTGKVFVGIFRDITERKRRTEQLKEAKKQAELSKLEAEEASRMKSAMLANMSHEIRTPLTGVIGFAEAIGEETGGEDTEGNETEDGDAEGEGKVARFAGLIEDSGRRLLDTLDAVLNLSKLEAGKMSLERKPVDLAGQARQVAREFEEEAWESGLTLGVETEAAWARADEGGLKIVLQNLLSNAIKYTEEGGVTVRVYREENSREERGQGENTRETSSQEASNQSAGQKAAEEAEAPTDSAAAPAAAVLEVEDSGIGMDPEVAGRLFEPFRQASEGMSREYEGTGIGLAVTKRATEEMGGSIKVDTQKGEGSRFTVRFPAARSAGSAGGPPAGEPQQADQRDLDKPASP
ncbi:ATP-binding protein [Salinibacter ruber]|uniref:histidine kinase n=1 Tax=Salinibacter ruber TaxID=146919 RepID=A0A9X2UNF7_9BACT|nr:ATP-binding protein [Salinibacter ruber]MCS3616765.1 PAS domain S-box-containing protein [Salinibacter ruber]MCS4038131.1 PAS domain S-box-containing protein [Salinibacter ruber]MCS4088155.1 PAS domain S-box-containing protein [Salinibacter ruber]